MPLFQRCQFIDRIMLANSLGIFMPRLSFKPYRVSNRHHFAWIQSVVWARINTWAHSPESHNDIT